MLSTYLFFNFSFRQAIENYNQEKKKKKKD
jgi:hypothetical protein